MEFDKIFYQKNFFKLERYRVSADKHAEEEVEENEATIKILVPAKNARGVIDEKFIAEVQPEDKKHIALSATSTGKGTVDALDSALRKLLVPLYPCLSKVKLIHYAVANSSIGGTASEVEVFILATNEDGKLYYSKVGSVSVIEATFFALSNIYNRYFKDIYLSKSKSEKKK
ncbi:MAG TPA: alpha-isopropylmalate synthase regulatory domain-containing protein [bacterium]|nr:alpha-isopropylmalate synthase regulatory domain-containing protein [bacterium]